MSTFHAVQLRRHDQPATAGPSLTLRLRVYATRGRLDRQIAGGRACASTPELALRASQLTDRRARRRLAHSLREVVDYAERRSAVPVISPVVLERAAVRGARGSLLALADRLDADAPVSPAGVARSQVLLTDGLGPLFNPTCSRTAAEAVRDAHDAL